MQTTKSAAQVDLEKQRLRKFVHNLIGDDADKYDVEAKYDSSLTYIENKNAVREDLNVLVNKLKEQMLYVRGQQDKLAAEDLIRIEQEVQEHNAAQQKAYVHTQKIDLVFMPVNRALDKLVQGYSHLAFVKGRGGIGKSYTIRNVLSKHSIEYVELCGDVTEAYLYRLFFENNGKVIWFKDVVRLLQGLRSINLLKSATEVDSPRLLTKNSYSKQQDDLPDKFIFKGKIVFDYNSLQGLTLKDDFEALTTRGDYVEFTLSTDDIAGIMREIAREDWQKAVTEFLIEHHQKSEFELLNLRTQFKAFQTFKFSEANKLVWKDEIMRELVQNKSRVRSMIYNLIGMRAVRAAELKKLLLRHELCGSLRTADRKIREWLEMDEIHAVSTEQKNFYICLEPLNW